MADASVSAANNGSVANNGSAAGNEPEGASVGLAYLARATRCGEGRPRVLGVWE